MFINISVSQVVFHIDIWLCVKIFVFKCVGLYITICQFQRNYVDIINNSWQVCSIWFQPWKIWWRHQMETVSPLLAICAGNSSVTDEFPAQRPVTRSFDVFFDLRLNKRLSKQSWGWWFETHRAHYDVTVMIWFSVFWKQIARVAICHVHGSALVAFSSLHP